MIKSIKKNLLKNNCMQAHTDIKN